MTTVWWLVGLSVLIACYVTWTAGRLDRLHSKVDARWAALDAQLVRRAAAARALADTLPTGEARERLAAAASRALAAGQSGREVVENDLSRAIRLAVPLVDGGGPAAEAKATLEQAAARVGLVRSFHNSAVTDVRAVRRRRLPRLLRLAGHRALPSYFDVDETEVA